MSDIYLGSMLNWGMKFGLIDKHPNFEVYCSGLLDRPAALRAMEQVEKLASRQAWTAS